MANTASEDVTEREGKKGIKKRERKRDRKREKEKKDIRILQSSCASLIKKLRAVYSSVA